MSETLTAALAALTDPDPARRYTAAQFLATQPASATREALLAALGDADRRAQEAITIALLKTPDTELLPQLARLLRDASPQRRRAAQSTLLALSARQPQYLVDALTHTDPAIRLTAVKVLGDLREPTALPHLTKRLADLAEASLVRQAAAATLGQLADAAAVENLITALTDRDEALRSAAVEALGQIGDKRAVPPLIRLYHTSPATRLTILKTLGTLGQWAALEVLTLALEDAQPPLRAASVEALTQIISEPNLTQRPTGERLTELRRTLSIAALVRELRANTPPSSSYAAYLLGRLAPLEALPDLVAALGQPDEGARYTASEAILQYGLSALSALQTALNDPQMRVREKAAELLGLLGQPEAVPTLLAHRLDPDGEVRVAIVRALGALGGAEAYVGLLNALEDPLTRDVALGLIGQSRDTNLIHALQNYLYEGGQSHTRRAAALALSLLGDEASVSILLNAARASDETVRAFATEALAQVRGQRAVGVLIEALGARDYVVRQKAVEALGYIPDGRALAALLMMTEDDEWRVRQALVGALVKTGEARSYEPLLKLAHDPDAWVRRTVMDLSAALEDQRATELLLLGARDALTEVRQAALIGLGRRRDPRAASMITASLSDDHPLTRALAVRALALIAAPDVIERLTPATRDPLELVRCEAAQALGDLGREAGIELLEDLLRDEVERVRAVAAHALAHIGSPAAAEALVAALAHEAARPYAQTQLAHLGEVALRALLVTTHSEQAEARRVAAEALGQLGATLATPTLTLLRRDPDTRVRQAAEAALKRIEAIKPVSD